ncbi:AAA family ATPase [Calderihabitans maritimus]|uniref:ATPase AAA n=1 Tax=Calderihabitans maritimus TaxID=1246530 RepID=A0A1Z5HPQ5_9FIRM|nr:MoxR family ATPase [Calderihabitans maritimus]GAW91509.1 ATPase AAA [Calderihabitans maritimus]
MFQSIDEVQKKLAEEKYLASEKIATAVFLACRLEKPLLVEGPAGVGKTELGKVVAKILGARLVRLQCYEGLDEAKALYEWNYPKQLLYIQSCFRENSWDKVRRDIYTPEFLLARPLLEALTSNEPTTLLIDELDKSDEEFESFLLEALSEFQVSIPELGTIKAVKRPTVVITSNNARQFSDALKRRCIYLYIDYPKFEHELQIIRLKITDIKEELARQVVRFVQTVRKLPLNKKPSISETLDWARTLSLLKVESLNQAAVENSLMVLLKNQQDLEQVQKKVPHLL